MIETANKIYRRKYSEHSEGNINGNEVLHFNGGGCKMVVLKEQFFRDEVEFKKDQKKRSKYERAN